MTTATTITEITATKGGPPMRKAADPRYARYLAAVAGLAALHFQWIHYGALAAIFALGALYVALRS